jgi:hypothetical protein
MNPVVRRQEDSNEPHQVDSRRGTPGRLLGPDLRKRRCRRRAAGPKPGGPVPTGTVTLVVDGPSAQGYEIREHVPFYPREDHLDLRLRGHRVEVHRHPPLARTLLSPLP